MADIEYRGTHLKALADGATGTQSDPLTVVRGLAIEKPDGTFAEVSDENPIPISLAPVPMGIPITTTIAPGGSIELIPAPTDPAQSIHLHGIYLTFSPNYVTGTESFEASIYAFKSGQPEIVMFPLPGIETFDGFPSPVEVEAGYSLRLSVPNTVAVTSVEVACSVQFRYGYPSESSGGGGGGTAVWGAIGGTLTDQIDLNNRLSGFDDEIIELYGTKQDQLTNGSATTYNAGTSAIDVVVDGTTIVVSGGALTAVGGGGGGNPPDGTTIALNPSSQLKVVYEPRPPTRGASIFNLPTSAPVYDSTAIAPAGKILRVSFHVSNYGASSANEKFSFKNSAGTEASPLDIYQKSVSSGGGWDATFSNFHIKNGESLGVYSNVAARLNANITSELIYEGDCQSLWLNATPTILDCTISIANRQAILLLFNATSTTSTYTIDVVDENSNVVSQLAVATALSGRNATILRGTLSAGRRLRVSSATVNEIFANIYAVESTGW